MGVRSSKTIPYSSDFNISEWINENYTSNDTGVLQYGKMRTLKNRNTEQLVDKYENAFISSKDYQDYVKSFEWRRHQNYIVRAYHIVTKNSTRYCSNTYHVDVYIEHPKNRLSDFSDIPFPDTLYCLKAMLTGYAKLYSNVGAFPVREQQVCIDQKGNVRVWLNKDLSKNFPEQWQIEPKIRSEDEEEEDMVNQIVQVVARNSDTQLQPSPTFLSFFLKNRNTQKLGFDETLMLIEQYAQINNTVIPDYFASVLQVYENQDDLYELQGGDQVNESLTHQTNNANNAFGDFGEITEREIRKNSIHGSRADRITNKSRRSKQSRSSQIERIEKHANKQNILNYNQIDSSRHSNKNVGETYRLSNLSKLDDGNKKQTFTGQRQSGQYTFTHFMNNFGNPNQNTSYRQSDQSNANHSQISYQSNLKNQTPVWMSLKPQQPYIPSSQAYLQMQNLGVQNQPKKYLNQFSSPTVRTQQTDRHHENLQASSNRFRENYSISQKAQQNNLSMERPKQRAIYLDQRINDRFQKQLQQQLLKDRLQQQAQERQIKSNKIKGSYVSEKGKFESSQHNFSNFQNSKNNLLQNDNSVALGSRQGSSSQLNQISNQPNTAQFIRGNSEENYRSLHHNSSTSHLGGLTKASSQRGFTIVIKPNINQSMAPVGTFSSFMNPSQQPTFMPKNNSQPYFPVQPIYQPSFYALPTSPHNSPRVAQNSFINNGFYKDHIFPQNNVSAGDKKQQNKQANKQNNSKKIETFYCTVADEVPLDPEIANDMLIYTSD